MKHKILLIFLCELKAGEISLEKRCLITLETLKKNEALLQEKGIIRRYDLLKLTQESRKTNVFKWLIQIKVLSKGIFEFFF